MTSYSDIEDTGYAVGRCIRYRTNIKKVLIITTGVVIMSYAILQLICDILQVQKP